VRRVDELSASEKTATVALCSEAHAVDFGALFDLVPPSSRHVLGNESGELVAHACWSRNEQPW
jgi:hypothetical protein